MPDPIPKAAKSGDVALAGRDGAALSRLVATATDSAGLELARLLADAVRGALARSGPAGPVGRLTTGEQSSQLVRLLEQAVATGAALGHYRIRERKTKAEAAGGFHRFAEDAEIPFGGAATAAGDLPLLPATSALAYFRRLVPTIGMDARHWVPAMYRTAFTLAVATEETLLRKVQDLIARRIESGAGYSAAPKEIEELITAAGSSPLNPQYCQMVLRTNVMDAFNVGQQLELESPDVAGFFPAWKYLGIRDGRQGEDHEPQFDRYYPTAVSFQRVRGPRPYNCRCTFSPVDKYQWADLRARGVDFSPVPLWPGWAMAA